MAGFRAAQRYAKSLMQFANETNQADVVYAEMNDVCKIIKESDDLKSFLNSPIIEASKKEVVLKEIFKSFSKTTNTFISLVVKQGRENILSKIADQFIANYNLANNIVTAEITSAVQLDQKTIDNIVAKAKQTLAAGSQVNVVNKIDVSLIGGFILKIGNTQIDSSIKTKLATLKKDFSK
ncbi:MULTISPECIES: ATP synthase F1 subunit delta [Empedobacter]|uniref:ATP synthase subunit delta n=1 Tax=Empedobacter falsenii TaxID=343874 RepID=A0A3R8TJM0_9FLAO|nr:MULTISPECIES: ATP synthase F1 subunit delta [Empedobacter]MDH0658359.1 ATP synthase F1 subunit delta [Empedobacter sp. GD03865]MDH0675240.1 ATP synthase F1 subunit delta [Empedobacter sp. GD03861]MDH1602914.1 ATP synthase F1 subunit delta [Empedobacter sp. GD03739]RRT87001.1 ATP synthase F1 subunit delta [Empedobacter falsenii]RRT88099.1 ATP synthase F1 subunit delta [Empedobacter falsenii]